MNLKDIFFQENNILHIKYIGQHITYTMPEYFNVNDVSDDLKILSLIVSFYPYDKSLIEHKFNRPVAGDNIALAFSGGVDSVAASCLLPANKTLLFNHKRNISYKTLFKYDNTQHVIDATKKNVLIIESDLEDNRARCTGKMPGFINDFAFFGGIILLADYLNIGYLSTGMMLESTYLAHGNIYRVFHMSDYYYLWFNLFKNANLPLFFPCIPCSEILTNKIVAANNAIAQSCLRGINGCGCNRCYKCFRKKLIAGELLEYKNCPEILSILSTRPLKQGASLIYGANSHGFKIDELQEYWSLNLWWLGGYFNNTLQSIPEEYRNYVKLELNKYTAEVHDTSLIENFHI